MPVRLKAILQILIVMVIWGSSFAVTKKAITQIPPLLFAFLRFAVASLLLLVLHTTHNRKTVHERRLPFWPLLGMGVTGVTGYYIFFNLSLLYTSASTGALIQAFIPVVIALLAVIFLKEKLSALQITGLLVSVIGVVLVGALSPADASARQPLLGNALMVVAVIAWGIYTILSKKLAGADVMAVTFYSTLAGTLLLLPAALIEGWHQPLPVIPAAVWLSVLYLGILASALSYFWYNRVLNELPASLVGIFINLDPVIGAGIAVIFLHEKITLLQVAGTVLVLAGVWLSSKHTPAA